MTEQYGMIPVLCTCNVFRVLLFHKRSIFINLYVCFFFFIFSVEVMSSMLNIGLGVGFLPGMFYDRFGPQWASAIGLVVSVGAYMLLWSTTRPSLIHFYSKSSWLMSIYFFIAGKRIT